MRVINVVEIDSGILTNITSFGIADEQLVDDVVAEAEEHYVKCCREHGALTDDVEDADENDVYTDDDLIDMETYDYEDYSVCIYWSDIDNIQI